MQWLALLFVLCLTGCAIQTQRSNETAIRVSTFNIRFATADDKENHWDLRQGALLDAIKDFDADILATQETLAVQRDFIVKNLPHYAAVAVGRDDGKDAGEMTATFYRKDRFDLLDSGHFWLSETPEVPGSKSWDTAITRMATWMKLRDRRSARSRPILVINTHFDHVGKTARLESAKLIARRAQELGGDCSTIILGDFNCTEDDAPYRALQIPGVFDAYRTAVPKRSKNEATFQAFDASKTAGNRIDWILCSEDFEVLSAQIDRAKRRGRLPSDHFAVNAVLDRG